MQIPCRKWEASVPWTAISRRDGNLVKPVGGGAGGAAVVADVAWEVLERRRA